MKTANVAKLILFCGALVLPVKYCFSQLSIIQKPASGQTEMAEVSEWGGYVNGHWVSVGVAPDYTAQSALPAAGSQGIFYGGATAGNAGVSGSLGVVQTSGINLRGGSNASHAVDVYSEVAPGSNVGVRFQEDLYLKWGDGTLYGPAGLECQAGFSFDALVGEDAGKAVNRNSSPEVLTGEITGNAQYSVAVQPPASSRYDANGKTYYKLGTFYFNGSAGMKSPDGGACSAEYRARITSVQAYYIGKALMMVAGNNQTGMTNKDLPNALSVKVSEGETGNLAPGVPITFTVMEPTNGATLSAASALTNADGIATTKLTLGSVPGEYTIKAACPAEVCTSGAREVQFSAIAISSVTDVVGTIPDAQERGCSQVSIGDKVAQINPADNSFRVLGASLLVNSLLPELRVSCRAGGICPVENAQTMPQECAGGKFGASRRDGTDSHYGIDLLTDMGAPVLSSVRGSVVHVGLFNGKRGLNESWGWTVIIQSERRIVGQYEVLLYGHLDPTKVYVRAGDMVDAGQQIAATGLYTGNLPDPVNCPHVHIERRLLAKPSAPIGSLPIPCTVPSSMLSKICEGPDMNSNSNGERFKKSRATNPDVEIGCGIY